MHPNIFVSVIVFAAVFSSANSIRCYNCFDCGTVNSTTTTITCPETPNKPSGAKDACYKGSGYISGAYTVQRGCGWSTQEFCRQETHVLLSGEYCYCNDDLCNDATTTKLNMSILLIISGILTKMLL